MQAGESLGKGQSLSVGPFALTLQDDGNLVLTDDGDVKWASGTNGKDVDKATLQDDGNFVLYAGSDPKWSTETNGKGGTKLTLQADRNAVIYTSGGDSVWATDTVTDTPYEAPAEPEAQPVAEEAPAPPPPPPPPAPRTVVVEPGDTLWAIAERELGDGNRYQEIANLSGIDNPDLINPGQVLTLP